jgi:hypothetical protein
MVFQKNDTQKKDTTKRFFFYHKSFIRQKIFFFTNVLFFSKVHSLQNKIFKIYFFPPIVLVFLKKKCVEWFKKNGKCSNQFRIIFVFARGDRAWRREHQSRWADGRWDRAAAPTRNRHRDRCVGQHDPSLACSPSGL